MSQKKKYTSIQSKMTMMVVVTIAVIITIGFSTITIRDMDRLRTELIRESDAYIELLSQDFVKLITDGTVDLASSITTRLRGRPMILGLTIYTSDNEAVFTYRKEGEVISTPDIQDWEEPHEFMEDILMIVRPIVYQGTEFGNVLLQVSTQHMQEIRNSYQSHGIIFALALMLAAFALFMNINQRLTTPILNLVDAMKKATETDDFTHGLPYERNDEIGELYGGFNSLQREVVLVKNNLESQKNAYIQHAIVSITDNSGNIIFVNNHFAEITGYTREELLGNNHRILNSGTHDEGYFRDMYKTISSGRTWDGEMCNRTRDGEIYWLDTTIVPQLDKNGIPDKYIAIRSEITAKRGLPG